MPNQAKTTKVPLYQWYTAIGLSDLPPMVRLVAWGYSCYADFATGQGVRPNTRTVAAQCGLDVRTVERHRPALIDAGWLVVTEEAIPRKRPRTYLLSIPEGFEAPEEVGDSPTAVPNSPALVRDSPTAVQNSPTAVQELTDRNDEQNDPMNDPWTYPINDPMNDPPLEDSDEGHWTGSAYGSGRRWVPTPKGNPSG